MRLMFHLLHFNRRSLDGKMCSHVHRLENLLSSIFTISADHKDTLHAETHLMDVEIMIMDDKFYIMYYTMLRSTPRSSKVEVV